MVETDRLVQGGRRRITFEKGVELSPRDQQKMKDVFAPVVSQLKDILVLCKDACRPGNVDFQAAPKAKDAIMNRLRAEGCTVVPLKPENISSENPTQLVNLEGDWVLTVNSKFLDTPYSHGIKSLLRDLGHVMLLKRLLHMAEQKRIQIFPDRLEDFKHLKALLNLDAEPSVSLLDMLDATLNDFIQPL